MKKEGIGRPRNPDIAFDADVSMREVYFEEVPDPEVRFWGSTERNSVWGSGRENLPGEVREGSIYRNAEVQLRVASEIIGSDPDFRNSSDKERVKTNLEYRERKTGEQEPESREKKEKK